MRLRPGVLEALGVLAVTVAAAIPRLLALGQWPPGLHGDEGWTGIEALRILREGPIGVWSPSALGQPAGPFYWTAALFLFLEPGIASVRASMALLGVLTVPASYLFYRALFGPRVAFLGTVLLAAGFWHLAYSRVAFPPVALPLVESLAFAALFVAFKRDRPLGYLLAGGLLGLGFYAYLPYPLVALGVGLFLLVWAGRELRQGRRPREVVTRLGLLAAGGFAVAGPFLAFLALHWDVYTGYGHVTFIPFMPGEAGEKISLLGRRLFQVLAALFLGRTVDYTDGLGTQSLLDPLTGLLFLAGLGMALWRWRDPRYLFVLLVLGFGLLSGVLSSSNWGENRRTIGALPAVYLLAGLGLSEVLGLLAPRLGRLRATLPAFAGVFLVLLAGLNLRAYFAEFAPAPTTRWVYAEEMARACGMLGAREKPGLVYFYAGRWSYRYETCRFLAPGLQAEDRSREFGTFRLEKTTPGPALYVFLAPYTDQAPAVQALYPGGRRTEERAGDGRLLFVAYEVS